MKTVFYLICTAALTAAAIGAIASSAHFETAPMVTRDMLSKQPTSQSRRLCAQRPYLVFFCSGDSPWLQRMETESFGDARVRTLTRQFVIMHVDTDTPDGSRIAERLGVRATPFVPAVSSRSGGTTVLAAAKGFQNADALVSLLRAALGQARATRTPQADSVNGSIPGAGRQATPAREMGIPLETV